MATTIPLFELNRATDEIEAARKFAANGRVQIRNFLSLPAAQTIRAILARETPWGLAWRAGENGPNGLRRQEVEKLTGSDKADIWSRVIGSAAGSDYAFIYAQYRMLDSYLEKWGEHQALDLLVEHINSEPLLSLVRRVSGIPQLKKADAQATLYAPNQFLAVHDDSHVQEGWQVAYVMNFCLDEWRPEWGGYLMFYDEDGDVVAGFRPRFNTLNLFRVPQKHSVSYVPPFAPVGRFSITGWFRDR